MKFCGITNPADAVAAVDAGADAIGMIFGESARRIGEDEARAIARELPPFVTPVGVFIDPSLDDVRRMVEAIPSLVVQLHGNESPAFANALAAPVIKAVSLAEDERDPGALDAFERDYTSATLLVDTAGATRGGTGRSFSWDVVTEIARRRAVIVAGGLTPENVGDCIRIARPFGVDTRSGVESGERKDVRKMRAFVRAVRDADAA